MPPVDKPDYLKERAKFLVEGAKVIASLFLIIATATVTALVKLFIDLAEHPSDVNGEYIVLIVFMVIGVGFAISLARIINNLLDQINQLINSLK